MSKEAMVDLECLGNDLNGIIVSVGLVIFDNQSLQISSEYHWLLDVDEQSRKGRTVNLHNVNWWIRQTPQAQAELTEILARVPIETFLTEFKEALGNAQFLWAKGILYDCAMLENMYISYGQRLAVPRSRWRDCRCVYDWSKRYKMLPEKPEGCIDHNALADAKKQTLVLLHYLREVRNALFKPRAKTVTGIGGTCS